MPPSFHSLIKKGIQTSQLLHQRQYLAYRIFPISILKSMCNHLACRWLQWLNFYASNIITKMPMILVEVQTLNFTSRGQTHHLVPRSRSSNFSFKTLRPSLTTCSEDAWTPPCRGFYPPLWAACLRGRTRAFSPLPWFATQASLFVVHRRGSQMLRRKMLPKNQQRD